MSEFNFEDCPIGQLNTERITHTAELLNKDMRNIMEKLEHQVTELDQKMGSRFDVLDSKIDALNSKVHSLDEKLEGVDNLDNFVLEKIENSKKDKVFNFFKWFITVLLSSTAVTVFGTVVLNLLKIGK